MARGLKNKSRKGISKERLVKKMLERVGYLVLRSAASKGPFDLVALRKNEVRLIQVKTNRHPSTEEEENLIEIANRLIPFSVEVWVFYDRLPEPEILTYP